MDKCKSCCPLKVIEDYKNLEKELAEDFAGMIKNWLKEHSYVDTVYLRDESRCMCGSMYIGSGNLYCNITLKKK